MISSKPDESEKGEKFKDYATGIIKDVFVAFVIVAIIIGGVFVYTGNWPPVVVVESKSMQHSPDTSFLGIIDTGDLVLVKQSPSRGDIVSYVEGRSTGYETYGDYGDVIVYRKNGFNDVTPVIHRALVWLEYNETSGNYDVPDLEGLTFGVDWNVSGDPTNNGRTYDISGSLILLDVGYDKRPVSIDLTRIHDLYSDTGLPFRSGFVTMGDFNAPFYDQGWLPDGHGGCFSERITCVRLVDPSWVVGTARGELPWFGLIKLYFSGQLKYQPAPLNSWHMLALSIGLIIFVPIVIDMFLAMIARRRDGIGLKAVDDLEDELEDGPGDMDDADNGIKSGTEDDFEEMEGEEPPPPDDGEDAPPPGPGFEVLEERVADDSDPDEPGWEHAEREAPPPDSDL